jgi:ankyrin repeat protein
MLDSRRLHAWLPVALAATALGAAAPDSRLPEAARAGDRETVNRLIAAGTAIDAPEPDGTTALHWAVYHDDLAMTGRLLDAGANVNAANRNGATPLTLACANSGAALVDRLLKAGADPSIAPSGAPPLLACAQGGAVSAVQMLIARGADVNAQDSWRGQTALMWAAAENHADLITVLLAGGAAVDARSIGNFTALMFAVRQDAREAARLLIAAGADPNARTEPTPIVHERWTDKGIYSASRPFMDNGVNLGGATPYLLAAQAADVDAMRLLQTLGADPRLTTYANTTAVMVAAGIGYVEGSRRYRLERDALEAVKLAAAAGVDVNALNANGQTALHGAVYRAANTVIRYLVEAGARTDFQDELERTPLMLAEQGFNQVASLIRREAAAALLKELGATSTPPARASRMPDAR